MPARSEDPTVVARGLIDGGFWLRELVRPPAAGQGTGGREDPEDGEEDPLPGIRCPKCAWQPRPSDCWQCSCNMVWNTFDTRARCPRCARQWLDTKCLACGQWSPHVDWYVAPSAAPR